MAFRRQSQTETCDLSPPATSGRPTSGLADLAPGARTGDNPSFVCTLPSQMHAHPMRRARAWSAPSRVVTPPHQGSVGPRLNAPIASSPSELPSRLASRLVSPPTPASPVLGFSTAPQSLPAVWRCARDGTYLDSARSDISGPKALDPSHALTPLPMHKPVCLPAEACPGLSLLVQSCRCLSWLGAAWPIS